MHEPLENKPKQENQLQPQAVFPSDEQPPTTGSLNKHHWIFKSSDITTTKRVVNNSNNGFSPEKMGSMVIL